MKNNSDGFTFVNLLVVIIILIIILIGVALIIKMIDKSAAQGAKERKAELIISSIELAYANAVLGGTSTPTINDIQNKFNVSGATWNNNKIETDLNFSCDVYLENNNLKVDCIGFETKKIMPFSD